MISLDDTTELLRERKFAEVLEPLLGSDPANAFAQTPESESVLMEHVASGIGVNVDDIIVVGSAKLGFSLSPRKFPKQFDTSSDIDLAIVNDELFDTAWLSLLHWYYYRRDAIGGKDKDFFINLRKSIIEGWLDPARLSFKDLIFRHHLKPIQEMSATWFFAFQRAPAGWTGPDRKIGARLYRSEAHLREYHRHAMIRISARLRKRG